MPRVSFQSLTCMIALVGCSGRGCGRDPQDDTALECAASDQQPWYNDQDGDGHGDLSAVAVACDAPAGYVANGDDCDDTQASGWQFVTRHTDGDGDGFGEGMAVEVCETATGYADNDLDCDDAASDVYPDAPLTCGDDVDQDCDGQSDCDAPTGTISANQADARIGGSDAGSLGAALIASDLNGDGIPDLGVGAPFEAGTGAVYVLYGPVDGAYSDDALDVHLSGNGEDMDAGTALASGDVDADGVQDLVIGAPKGSGSLGGHAVYIVPGPLPGALVLDGEQDQWVLKNGYGAAIIADYDYVGDDGIADLVIGEGYTSVYLKEGAVSRSIDLETNNDGEVLRGDSATGHALAILGDVTGDGVSDLGIGAPEDGNGDDVVGGFYGNFYLIDSPELFGVADEDLTFWRAYVLGPDESGGLFAWSLAPAGDQDGDGYADVAVGAPGVSGGAGAVYLYSGDALSRAGSEDVIPAENALAKISPADDAMQLGYSLSGGTDANGDGAPDLLIGAPGDYDGRGAVTLWYGPLLDDVDTDEASYTLTGETEGDTFGAAVNLLADMNGLGRPDVLAGATGVNGGDGAVYLFFTDGL